MKKNILYISWDGILEPLGQSQILSYIKHLSINFNFYLISFEKKRDYKNIKNFNEISLVCNKLGIKWFRLNYSQNIPFISNLLNLIKCFFLSFYIILRYKINLIHSRSYPSAFIGLLCKKIFKIKLIFDMRGFWIDEKVDAGLWKKKSFIYNYGKKIEKLLIKNSDVIISLSENGKIELNNTFGGIIPPIFVIRTCTDLKKFTPKIQRKNALTTLGYVGNVKGWYLFEPVLNFYQYFKNKQNNSVLRIFNITDHEYIKKIVEKFNFDENDIILEKCSFSNIPNEMKKIDIGIFFIQKSFSKKASCATKLGEFLATGIPIITNDGIGDHSEILLKSKTGIILKKFDNYNMKKSVDSINNLLNDSNLSKRCQKVSRDFFSLEAGVKTYLKVYNSLLQ